MNNNRLFVNTHTHTPCMHTKRNKKKSHIECLIFINKSPLIDHHLINVAIDVSLLSPSNKYTLPLVDFTNISFSIVFHIYCTNADTVTRHDTLHQHTQNSKKQIQNKSIMLYMCPKRIVLYMCPKHIMLYMCPKRDRNDTTPAFKCPCYLIIIHASHANS